MYLLFILAIFSAAAGAAEPYPVKPVRIIVAVAPGGSVDMGARMIAGKLTERLGRQVFVENRAGGGGVIGVEFAAKSLPDGYTLLIVNPTQVIQPALRRLPYDPVNAFAPIAKLESGTLTLVVHPSVPARSVKELIALTKKRPDQLVMASAGTGSVIHMAIELFKTRTGTDFLIVQYKSAGPGVVDLLGGRSHAMMVSFPAVLPYIKSGRLRLLGTGGGKRSAVMPDVPTLAEAGVPGYNTTNWFGIVAAGTPGAIVEKLNAELQNILASDDVRKTFLNDGAEADYLGPAEFALFLQREMAQWASIIKKANIKAED